MQQYLNSWDSIFWNDIHCLSRENSHQQNYENKDLGSFGSRKKNEYIQKKTNQKPERNQVTLHFHEIFKENEIKTTIYTKRREENIVNKRRAQQTIDANDEWKWLDKSTKTTTEKEINFQREVVCTICSQFLVINVSITGQWKKKRRTHRHNNNAKSLHSWE